MSTPTPPADRDPDRDPDPHAAYVTDTPVSESVQRGGSAAVAAREALPTSCATEAHSEAHVAAMLEAIDFVASDSDDLLLQACARNPGDLIEVTETAIGASSLDMIIQSIELSIERGHFTRCKFGLACTIIADVSAGTAFCIEFFIPLLLLFMSCVSEYEPVPPHLLLYFYLISFFHFILLWFSYIIPCNCLFCTLSTRESES